MELLKSSNFSSTILANLMTSLFYPAILGSWIFSFLSKVFELFNHYHTIFAITSKLEIWFGLYLILYFSMSFWDTYSENSKFYKIKTSLIDFIEIGIICLSFYYLGFFNKLDDNGIIQSTFSRFYIVMLFLPLIHPIWSKIQGYRKVCLPDVEQFIRFALFFSGIWLSSIYEWYNIVVIIYLIIISVFLLFYQMSNNIRIMALWDKFLFGKSENDVYKGFGITIRYDFVH